MADDRGSILIDARVNALPGGHGLARSVMKLVAHMSEPADGLALRVLVNPREEQTFPLSALPAHADLIGTDVTVFAQHRSRELARQIRAADAAVLYMSAASLQIINGHERQRVLAEWESVYRTLTPAGTGAP